MTIFLPYYVAAFALVFFELRGSTLAGIPLPVPRLRTGVWIAIVAVLYAAQLAIVWYATRTLVNPEPWRAALPIPVAEHGIAHPDAVEAALLGGAALQSYALVAIYRSGISKAALLAGFAILTTLSIAAPAFVSPDPYAYLGDALLGRAAYAPPAGDLPGTYALVNRLFTPLLPAPYGPLWMSLVQIVVAPAPTMLAKLLVLRVFGAGCLTAAMVFLGACGVPRRLLAVAALNPALAQQYVADAHNDVLGIALLIAAAAAMRVRRPIAGAALVALAGLVKLPLVVVGLPVLARAKSRAVRYACTALAIGLAVAISWYGAGASYFRGLGVHAPAPGPVYAFNLAIVLVGLLLIGLAWLGERRLRSAVWVIPMMSSYIATWYVPYGLAYALARHRILAYLLIALPFACAMVDAKFMRPWTYAVVLPLAVLYAVLRKKNA